MEKVMITPQIESLLQFKKKVINDYYNAIESLINSPELKIPTEDRIRLQAKALKNRQSDSVESEIIDSILQDLNINNFKQEENDRQYEDKVPFFGIPFDQSKSPIENQILKEVAKLRDGSGQQ